MQKSASESSCDLKLTELSLSDEIPVTSWKINIKHIPELYENIAQLFWGQIICIERKIKIFVVKRSNWEIEVPQNSFLQSSEK